MRESVGFDPIRSRHFPLFLADSVFVSKKPYNFYTMNPAAITENITAALLARLHNEGLSLAVAESCTGGRIADLVTDIPGASAVFKAGVVAYSADAKTHLLGVDPKIIAAHGVVSAITACAMAAGIRLRGGADYAIAITGNLGPAVLEGKPCGLVHIAVSSAKALYSRDLQCAGDRAANKQEAALAALRLLKEILDRELPDAEKNT